MATRIILPAGGQTTDESLVTYWYKKVGDAVRLGEPLFSIETDKATMDVESCAEGTLLAICHDADETVKAGETMAWVGKAGEALPTCSAATQAAAPATAALATSTPAPAPLSSAAPAYPIKADSTAAPAKAKTATAPASAHADGPVLASPAARKLARDNNLSLGDIAVQTGRQPVKRSDVAEALAEPHADATGFTLLDMSPSRRAIAQRMVQSVSVAPQFQVTVTVDMERALALRTLLNAQSDSERSGGVKVSYNDILMMCACRANEKFPLINSCMENGKLKLWKAVHFGLAVSNKDGLVVPVVRNAQAMTLGELARCNALNIAAARAGTLRQDQISGGTITLTNLGMFGVTSFTAILNPPEVCILAVGSILETPVVRQGILSVGHTLTITATYDHRVIDGAYGAGFLQELKRLLENVELLLL